jgi:TRAP-type C4-dicarboxylate transport system substrate-binding protein
MRKLLAIGFVLALILGVIAAACGGGTATTTTAAPAANAQEPVVIKYACTGQETETVGQEVKYFTDYVTSKVPAVTFDIYYGGTLASGMEDLPLLSSGGVDMISLGHPPYGDLIPLLCGIPMFAPGDEDNPSAGIDYFNTLCFDDPNTAALIQAEAEKNNVKYLAWMTTGGSVFEAKKPFTKIADLVGGKFGVFGDPTPYTNLGLTVTSIAPPDIYEALRTGVIDSTTMGFAPIVSALKWYEVAPYFLWDNTLGAGQCITINLDVWNSLTPETQAIFQEAADATSDYSIQLDADQTAAGIQTVEDAGGSIDYMTDEDFAVYYAGIFKSAADAGYTRADGMGIGADMVTVLDKAAELTGQTWTPPAM